MDVQFILDLSEIDENAVEPQIPSARFAKAAKAQVGDGHVGPGITSRTVHGTKIKLGPEGPYLKFHVFPIGLPLYLDGSFVRKVVLAADLDHTSRAPGIFEHEGARAVLMAGPGDIVGREYELIVEGPSLEAAKALWSAMLDESDPGRAETYRTETWDM